MTGHKIHTLGKNYATINVDRHTKTYILHGEGRYAYRTRQHSRNRFLSKAAPREV